MIDIAFAVLLDLIIGDPVYRYHPIRLMGYLIGWEERFVRRYFATPRGLFVSGAILVVLNMAVVSFIPLFILKKTEHISPLYHIINIYFLYSALSAGCLRKEALKVLDKLSVSLTEARIQISYLVGRDTNELSEEEVTKAAVETVAENTSDGVIAPLFFIFLLGAPGALLYKMVNTMDSMLGYLTVRYKEIGFFPAKTDDVFNYIPARITGVAMVLSSAGVHPVARGFKILLRDRRNHKSPNCGYPEAAVAGLLGVRLGGTHLYHNEIVEKPTLGDSLREIEKSDIKKTNAILLRTEILFLVVSFCLILWFFRPNFLSLEPFPGIVSLMIENYFQ